MWGGGYGSPRNADFGLTGHHNPHSWFGFLPRTARSRLVFTYVGKDFIDDRAMYGRQQIQARYVERKTRRFGMDPQDVAGFLSTCGWDIVEHLGGEEVRERYVAPTGEGHATTPIERSVYAANAVVVPHPLG